MVWKSNLPEYFYQRKSTKLVTKMKLDHMGVTFYQFLGTKVVHDWKKLKRIYKNYSKNTIWKYQKKVAKKIVNYLDVTLNDGTFRSYHKPNKKIQYIHKKSNHLPNIVKRLLTSIENRLSNLPSNGKLFHESTAYYQDNLWQSGYIKNLVYKPTDKNQQKHNKHMKKIIGFNASFNKSVSTKMGKSFLSFSELHFRKNHIYNSIFNKHD